MMSPNLAFALAVLGALGVYIEFVRPGTVFPGLGGCLLLAFSGYSLSRHPIAGLALALIGAAVLLFLVEVIWNTRFAASILGTAVLSAGSVALVPGKRGISGLVGCSMSILFGATTAVLAAAARRARRNKWADLPK